MTRLLPLLALLIATAGFGRAAEAQQRPAPQRLGAFQSWTAATHQDGVCRVVLIGPKASGKSWLLSRYG
jgi:ribosome-interacting GTPase 1